LNLLAKTYQSWEIFDHKNALASINKLSMEIKNNSGFKSEINNNDGLSSIIGNAYGHLKSIKDAIESNKKETVILLDIIASAKRRIDENKFDDATARLYRALEYIAQLTLAEKYKIPDTGKIPKNEIPKKFLEDRKNRIKNGYMQLGLVDSFSLLNSLDDEIGKIFMDDYQSNNSQIKKHLEKRNKSILAHGLNSISKQSADKFYNWIVDFAENVDKDFLNKLNKIRFYKFDN